MTELTTSEPAPMAVPAQKLRQKGLIDLVPRARHYVTEHKLLFQTLVTFAIVLASGHDAHLADTMYGLGLDIFGDAINLPRDLLNLPEAAHVGALTLGGGG